MENDSSSSIISPGIRLSKGTGGPGDYHYEPATGWYSPYSDEYFDPYEGVLNFAKDANLASHPRIRIPTTPSLT